MGSPRRHGLAPEDGQMVKMGYLSSMSNLVDHLQRFLLRYGLCGSPVYVGFSGGADSTALLWLLTRLGQPVTAIHFHHGLRGASADADAAFCQVFCTEQQIPFRQLDLRVLEQRGAGEGIEACGRRLRLAAWQEIAGGELHPVLLGHHADDALEELFLRLGRGGNVSALTGLRERRRIGRVTFYRPLLAIRKAALEELLAAEGIQPCLDASNLDCSYRRNAVRNRLLPLFREIFTTDAGPLRSLPVLRQESLWLEESARKLFGRLSDRSDWQAVPAALLPRVVRQLLQQEFGLDLIPDRRLLERLAAALAAPSGRRLTISVGGGRWLRVDDAGLRRWTEPLLLLERRWRWREQPHLSLPEISGSLEVARADGGGNGDNSEIFAVAVMPEELTVRARRPGDRMVPFGSTQPRKVQDLLVNARIPREERDAIPLLLADAEIIWIPGVRRAEFGRCVSGEARVVLRFHAGERGLNA